MSEHQDDLLDQRTLDAMVETDAILAAFLHLLMLRIHDAGLMHIDGAVTRHAMERGR